MRLWDQRTAAPLEHHCPWRTVSGHNTLCYPQSTCPNDAPTTEEDIRVALAVERHFGIYQDIADQLAAAKTSRSHAITYLPRTQLQWELDRLGIHTHQFPTVRCLAGSVSRIQHTQRNLLWQFIP